MAGHHRRHSEEPSGMQLSLIITPFLDMSFQILAFFIMTYHPSALEGHIPGSLVPPEKVATKGQVNKVEVDLSSVTPDALLAETAEAITVNIKGSVKSPGEPNQFLMRRAADTNDQVVADTETGGLDQGIKALTQRLKETQKEVNEKSNIKLIADGEIRQEFVMKVYDACKKAGFHKIHFVPPPLERTK